MFSSLCEKLLLNLCKICHEIPLKPMYVRTDAGGWFKLKSYSRVEGGRVGQKCDDYERTYFMYDP